MPDIEMDGGMKSTATRPMAIMSRSESDLSVPGLPAAIPQDGLRGEGLEPSRDDNLIGILSSRAEIRNEFSISG